MMRFKAGVKLQGIQPEIVATFQTVEAAFAPKEAVITSANDGKEHRRGSLHYSGNAIDLRVRHLVEGEAVRIHLLIKTSLTDEYDVLHEHIGTDEEHIHIEFQPKS